MPAIAPATMPRISFETFSVSSALRERDLLAHEELHLLGDLLDRLAELGGAWFSHRCS